jgi:hypothetical protein
MSGKDEQRAERLRRLDAELGQLARELKEQRARLLRLECGGLKSQINRCEAAKEDYTQKLGRNLAWGYRYLIEFAAQRNHARREKLGARLGRIERELDDLSPREA